jgi:hypothetical protein
MFFRWKKTLLCTNIPQIKPHIQKIEQLYIKVCLSVGVEPISQELKSNMKLEPRMCIERDGNFTIRLVYTKPFPITDYIHIEELLTKCEQHNEHVLRQFPGLSWVIVKDNSIHIEVQSVSKKIKRMFITLSPDGLKTYTFNVNETFLNKKDFAVLYKVLDCRAKLSKCKWALFNTDTKKLHSLDVFDSCVAACAAVPEDMMYVTLRQLNYVTPHDLS